MIEYVNHFMIIFLNINLNVRNERKMVIELKGCADFKLRHFTLLNSHYVKLSIFKVY